MFLVVVTSSQFGSVSVVVHVYFIVYVPPANPLFVSPIVIVAIWFLAGVSLLFTLIVGASPSILFTVTVFDVDTFPAPSFTHV